LIPARIARFVRKAMQAGASLSAYGMMAEIFN
jgi:hypothetical protein